MAAIIIIVLSATAGTIVVGKNTFSRTVVDSHGHDKIQIRCDMDKGACTKQVSNMEITLNITPKPVHAMKELAFTVVLKYGGKHEKLIIDLSMPGMFMGRNRVILRRTADGKYAGKGVIPKCPSGAALWQATVDIPETGKIDFLFHVAH